LGNPQSRFLIHQSSGNVSEGSIQALRRNGSYWKETAIHTQIPDFRAASEHWRLWREGTEQFEAVVVVEPAADRVWPKAEIKASFVTLCQRLHRWA
jgi:hypothetical protein